MNLQSPMATALLRGTYWALGSGALIFLTTYGTTDELKASLISGGIAALGRDVQYDEMASKPGTWHWPERD